jgi:Fe-S-cluster-containing hydrogenase component 2
MTAVVLKRKCPAQNDLCQAIPACPNDAIYYLADENEPLGGKILVDSEKCNDCGACVQACCGQAMEIN